MIFISADNCYYWKRYCRLYCFCPQDMPLRQHIWPCTSPAWWPQVSTMKYYSCFFKKKVITKRPEHDFPFLCRGSTLDLTFTGVFASHISSYLRMHQRGPYIIVVQFARTQRIGGDTPSLNSLSLHIIFYYIHFRRNTIFSVLWCIYLKFLAQNMINTLHSHTPRKNSNFWPKIWYKDVHKSSRSWVKFLQSKVSPHAHILLLWSSIFYIFFLSGVLIFHSLSFQA